MGAKATAVIGAPLAEVESHLRLVEQWPGFLGLVEGARRTAHERYVFTVRQGWQTHDVPLAVVARPREHRISWRALSGPAWNGHLRTSALDDFRTRVVLELVAHPRSVWAHLTEMMGGLAYDPLHDLQRLAERLGGAEDGSVSAA